MFLRLAMDQIAREKRDILRCQELFIVVSDIFLLARFEVSPVPVRAGLFAGT